METWIADLFTANNAALVLFVLGLVAIIWTLIGSMRRS